MNHMNTMNRIIAIPTTLIAAALAGCSVTINADGHEDHAVFADSCDATIDQTLDRWHLAASAGDADAYFGAMTPDAVFLGTDASERWIRDEFRVFAEPHFADGHGWTYEPRDRYIQTNTAGDVAWVDEILDHDSYGVLRGTAVLTRNGDRWRIAHYSLSFLVPNDLAGDVVDVISGEGE